MGGKNPNLAPEGVDPSLTHIDDWSQVQPGHSACSVLTKEGDFKATWDPAKPEDLAAAKATFDALKLQGYQAFSVKLGEPTKDAAGKETAPAKEERDALLAAFDPAAGRVLFVKESLKAGG